jgi:peptidoglycan pentaglycine glycine transferase (the first glycine)
LFLKLITAEDAGRFDDFIQSNPNGHIFQSYLWGEIKKPAWEPIRVIMEDEKGRIVAAATVLKRKIPILRKTFFYLPRGPVFCDWNNQGFVLLFMTHLQQLARSHRAILVKIDPCLPEREAELQKTLKQAGFVSATGNHDFGGLQPRYTFRLNIEQDLEEVMNLFPKKIRYKIRYGEKKGLRFVHPGEEGLKTFTEMMLKTGERANFVARNLSYYQKVFRILSQREAIDLTIGLYGDEPITAGITFAFGDKAWAAYGCQADLHKNLYAYHAMIWERIKWAHGKGAKWFDFYGVPDQPAEDHPLYGIYHFKKSFGGQYLAFIGEKDLIISPIFYWFWSRLFPTFRNMALSLIKTIRLFRSTKL